MQRSLPNAPVSACATISKERGHAEAAQLVEQRSGLRTSWDQGSPAADQIEKRLDELLNGGLTRDRAVEIALVNNPTLQATYEELGVSQADMVQAGLLSNPSLRAARSSIASSACGALEPIEPSPRSCPICPPKRFPSSTSKPRQSGSASTSMLPESKPSSCPTPWTWRAPLVSSGCSRSGSTSIRIRTVLDYSAPCCPSSSPSSTSVRRSSPGSKRSTDRPSAGSRHCAVIARLEAQHRQAERRLAALSVNARSEVRVAELELSAARQTIEHYRRILLPLRERVVEQSQLQYNGMQIGLFELLAAKQAQVEAYRSYIEAVRDYWVARAELERVMGGRIGSPTKLTTGGPP